MSVGSVGSDSSAEAWAAGTIASAEAYVVENGQPTDGVEPPMTASERAQEEFWRYDPNRPPEPAPVVASVDSVGSEGDPTAGGASGVGTGGGSPNGGTPAGGYQMGVPTQMTQQEVDDMRALGFTVTSAGDGKYIINVPYDPAHDVRITEKPPVSPLPGVDPPSAPPETPPPPPPADAGAAAVSPDAPNAVEPEPVVTGLGDEVDEIASKSPTLQKHLAELKKDGWTFQYGKSGVGAVDHGNKIVYVDPSLKGSPGKSAAVLAHEVGHARNPAAFVSTEGKTREQYIEERIKAELASEGAAALETVGYANEAGGALDIAGLNDPEYRDIHFWMDTDQISREEAIARAGELYGDGELHGASGVTYRDHFRQAAEQDWDRAHGR
jgi:hypothetical protein